MRRPVLALAILAGVVLTIAGAGVAQAAPVLHLSGWKASAGKPETFTITRIGGNGPATVTFHTTNGTAVAPTDYVATTKTISWQSGQITATVQVPTFINMAKAGTSVAFTATIAGSGSPSSATGLIVEPAAPPPPPPLPPNPQVVGPVVVTALCSEKSLWDTPQWEAYIAANPATPPLPAVTAGKQYNVTYEPGGQQGGLVPNTYTGPFIFGVPADGSGALQQGGWEFDPKCFPAAPVTTGWIAAPLQDGSFARVKANDADWDMTGPGPGRKLAPGEIVAVYFNGWGYDADSSASFAIYALSDGSSGRAKAADLEGVAPIGTPPGLPADWWVPGLVAAAKTCTDPRQGHAGEPGVTQGGVYRAAMLAGSHMKLATGETGTAGAMWQVFGSGDQNAPATMAFTVVTGDCLTGR